MHIYTRLKEPESSQFDSISEETRLIDPSSLVRKHRLRRLLSRPIFSILAIIFGLYNLIGDDIRHLSTDRNGDIGFYVFNGICIVFFGLDLVVRCLVSPKYARGVLVWLDLLATVAMILDFGMITSSTFNYRGKTTYLKLPRLARLALSVVSATAAWICATRSGLQCPAAAKAAATAAARGHAAAREVTHNPIRLFSRGARLSLAKKWTEKCKMELRGFAAGAPPTTAMRRLLIAAKPDGEAGLRVEKIRSSSRRLLNRAAQIGVVVVLLLVASIPLFKFSTFRAQPSFFESASLFIGSKWPITDQLTRQTTIAFLDRLARRTKNRILYAGISLESNSTSASDGTSADIPISSDNEPLIFDNSVPLSHYRRYEITEFSRYNNPINSTFHIKVETILENNILALLNIARVIIAGFALSVSAVLLASRSLTALAPVDDMISRVEKMGENPLLAARDPAQLKVSDSRAARLEPAEVNRVLIRFSHILVLGFGRAASAYLSSHVRESRPPAPRKVPAVFAFVYVGEFHALGAKLRAKLPPLLNELARVLHSKVHKYQGDVNKNIGEAFLLVFHDAYACDRAVLALIEALLAVQKSVFSYGEPPHVVAGVHFGEALEGAIGSHRKLDYSYLGPAVNTASRIAACAKQFNVDLLISGEVADNLRSPLRRLARRVDRVYVKGSRKPLEVLSVDLDLKCLARDQPVETSWNNFLISRKEDELFASLLGPEEIQIHVILDQIEGLPAARRKFTPQMYQLWNKANLIYEKGDFEIAAKLFGAVQNLVGYDGPATTILNFIKASGGKAPKDWNGVRKLLSK